MLLQRAARSLFKANNVTNKMSVRSLQKTTFNLPDPAGMSLPLTKIVATIGPTSEQREPMHGVVEAGMRIMRLNFSHATTDEVELRMENLHHAQVALQPSGFSHDQHSRAILLDTKGPEIRSGKLANDTSGHDTVTFEKGATVTLFGDAKRQEEHGSTAENLYIDYPNLSKCLKVGGKVLLDDGAITLSVKSINESDKTVECVVDNTGELRSRAGVNLPFADTSDLPAMSDKDRADIKYGMTLDVDFIAASFVQSAQGVREIREHLNLCAKELNWPSDRPLPMIISKIETAGALTHFDDILKESDGIMVARGDLGVEIPLTQVTNAQKEMVAACNAVGKPVVVATQMLESMAKSPRPTRAEVSDVSNAVYDGADCVMLSGETAKGKFPTTVVQTMNEILNACETYATNGAMGFPTAPIKFSNPDTAEAAIAKAAVAASNERGCAAILVLTTYGSLPSLVAANRPHVPILAFCPTVKAARQLQIYRSIFPVIDPDIHSKESPVTAAIEDAKKLGHVKSGDEVAVVFMEKDMGAQSAPAQLRIATVA